MLGLSTLVMKTFIKPELYKLEKCSNHGPNPLPYSESAAAAAAAARCVYSYPYDHSDEVGFFNKLTETQSLRS
jgi:hypothetical protein